MKKRWVILIIAALFAWPMLRVEAVKNFSASSVLSQIFLQSEMSISVTPYRQRVATGDVPGSKIIHKFGRNPDVDTGVVEDIEPLGGTRIWLQSPVLLEAISTDADDTLLGSGARVITIQGLDGNFDELEEDLEMNGLVVTASTLGSFIRVNRVIVKSSGVYDGSTLGANEGQIIIRAAGAGATEAIIPFEGGIGFGRSAFSAFTCPRMKTCLITQIIVNVDSTKPARLIAFARENADVVVAPFSAKQIAIQFDGIAQLEQLVFQSPLIVPEKSDIWFGAIATANNTPVEVDYTILQVSK